MRTKRTGKKASDKFLTSHSDGISETSMAQAYFQLRPIPLMLTVILTMTKFTNHTNTQKVKPSTSKIVPVEVEKRQKLAKIQT